MRSFRKNILLVCEGETSEPEYFNNLRDLLIENNADINIVIKPRPKTEQKEEEPPITR